MKWKFASVMKHFFYLIKFILKIPQILKVKSFLICVIKFRTNFNWVITPWRLLIYRHFLLESKNTFMKNTCRLKCACSMQAWYSNILIFWNLYICVDLQMFIIFMCICMVTTWLYVQYAVCLYGHVVSKHISICSSCMEGLLS